MGVIGTDITTYTFDREIITANTTDEEIENYIKNHPNNIRGLENTEFQIEQNEYKKHNNINWIFVSIICIIITIIIIIIPLTVNKKEV